MIACKFFDFIAYPVYAAILNRGVQMLTKIQKWGNSQGRRITKIFFTKTQIQVGDELGLSVKNDVIVISSAKKILGPYKLEELIAHIPANYKSKKIDWGKPVSKEV
jgi:antitoxin MazE